MSNKIESDAANEPKDEDMVLGLESDVNKRELTETVNGNQTNDHVLKSEASQVGRSASSTEQDWAPATKMHRKQHSMSEESLGAEERGESVGQSLQRRVIKKSRVNQKNLQFIYFE